MEHASRTLPPMIKQALESLVRSFRGHMFPAAVSGVLSDCITRFDHSITADFTRMFPGGPAALQGMSSTQIRHLFQDRASGPRNLTAVTRCLQGSTVILTLTDPSRHNLWIANLGDCQAGEPASTQSSPRRPRRLVLPNTILVLGSRTHPGDWSAALVTVPHDCENPSEVLRIRNQHPGELECVKDNRIVGFLGPTRCEHYVGGGAFEYFRIQVC